MKHFFKSKINWTGIILILVAILPIIQSQDFSGMGTKDWITFGIGILIVILRTWFTSTKIGTTPATPIK